ncbi:MAG: hypothetical protein EB060_00870 [Proteobacteria bacterium]|nr:hypothetical protein [Pseudomonadota bacterium]
MTEKETRYYGIPAQHDAAVQILKEAVLLEPDAHGLYPLIVVVGPMQVGKSTFMKRAAGLTDDTPVGVDYTVSGRPFVNVSTADMEEVRARNPEEFKGKVISFQEEGGERLLLIAERTRDAEEKTTPEGMNRLLADLAELRKSAPVLLDISHSKHLMFPTDWGPDEDRLKEIAVNNLNVRNDQLAALEAAGGMMITLDRDQTRVMDTLRTLAQSDRYRNAAEVPAPDPILEYTDKETYDAQCAAAKGSRRDIRGELARGLMMNADGPVVIEVMERLMRGGVSNEIIAGQMFRMSYEQPEVQNPAAVPSLQLPGQIQGKGGGGRSDR